LSGLESCSKLETVFGPVLIAPLLLPYFAPDLSFNKSAPNAQGLSDDFKHELL
jgi:hypothetical protein